MAARTRGEMTGTTLVLTALDGRFLGAGIRLGAGAGPVTPSSSSLTVTLLSLKLVPRLNRVVLPQPRAELSDVWTSIQLISAVRPSMMTGMLFCTTAATLYCVPGPVRRFVKIVVTAL